MEYQPLPPLRTWLNKEVPSATLDQLNYLWKAGTVFFENDIPISDGALAVSHRLSRSFVEAARANKVDLPPSITDRICSHCSIILVPAITCSVRVRQRSRHSKVNRTDKERVKNELVVHCKLCDQAVKAPGYLRKKLNSSISRDTITSNITSSKTSTNNKNVTANKEIPVEKKKFSFLNKASAGPGGLNRPSMLAGKLDNSSSDFISFGASSGLLGNTNLNQANSKHLQALSKGFQSGGRSVSTAHTIFKPAATTPGTMNLLELEAMNKKKRRKSVGPMG